MFVHQVDEAGHQAFQALARAEALAFGNQTVRVQLRQHVVHACGRQREVELHLGSAARGRHVGQARAFGQHHVERVADQ